MLTVRCSPVSVTSSRSERGSCIASSSRPARGSGHRQAHRAALAAALLRHSPNREPHRHWYHSGAARPCQARYHRLLYQGRYLDGAQRDQTVRSTRRLVHGREIIERLKLRARLPRGRRHLPRCRSRIPGRSSRAPEPRPDQVMSAIETCRTSIMGGHVEACTDCGHCRVGYNAGTPAHRLTMGQPWRSDPHMPLTSIVPQQNLPSISMPSGEISSIEEDEMRCVANIISPVRRVLLGRGSDGGHGHPRPGRRAGAGCALIGISGCRLVGRPACRADRHRLPPRRLAAGRLSRLQPSCRRREQIETSRRRRRWRAYRLRVRSAAIPPPSGRRARIQLLRDPTTRSSDKSGHRERHSDRPGCLERRTGRPSGFAAYHYAAGEHSFDESMSLDLHTIMANGVVTLETGRDSSLCRCRRRRRDRERPAGGVAPNQPLRADRADQRYARAGQPLQLAGS